MNPSLEGKKRWIAFVVLCLGVLMIVLDTTIVNVALSSIKEDLGFDDTSLAWVVNAYMLTFGGFLLLSGRLGDLFGHRRMLLVGLAVFTLASFACGVATTKTMLIAARAIQGLGGAVVSAVSLSLVMNIFHTKEERAKAMGFYGFVAAGGGSVGLMAGGLLTSAFDWHWNFLVNIPIGIGVFVASLYLLPAGERQRGVRLDLLGSILVTASLLLAVYAVVNGNVEGWTSKGILRLFALSAGLMIGFLLLESRVRSPLVPLAMFRLRNLATANVVGVLWAAAMFAWFFISALYMGIVLGYTPLQIGLSLLPSNLIMAAFSVGLSAKIVMRFGIRTPLALGLLVAAAGLALFARAPVGGSFVTDVLPGMLLLGLGAGMAFNPVLLAAMSDVKPNDAGLASGLVNTSFMMGGSLGLAVLASLAAATTERLGGAGPAALNAGYQAAFVVGAAFAALAAAIGALGLRTRAIEETPAPPPAPVSV